MARIPISRVLSLTDYSGCHPTLRMTSTIGLLQASPLEKIAESNHIRTQQVQHKGFLDEVGLCEYTYYSTFNKVLGVFSLSWITLHGIKLYCESRTIDSTKNRTSDEIKVSNDEIVSRNTEDQPTGRAKREFQAPSIFGWPSTWRPMAHIGPFIHPILVRSGDVDVLLENLCDPFQSYWLRQYHLDALESVTRRACAIHDILERKQLHNIHRKREQKPNFFKALDYTKYCHPLSVSDIVASLFPSDSFTETPENVDSPLCNAFWPVLRLIALSNTATWNDIFKSIGYKPSESLGKREFGRHHIDSGVLLKIVSDIVKACPAEDREVPLCFLKGLVACNDEYWLQQNKTEEYRAHIVKLLLENEQNCLKVFDSEALILVPCDRSNEYPSERPRLVLEYLYNPINEVVSPLHGKKKYMMSSIIETQDIHYHSLLQINNAVRHRSLRNKLPGSWLLRIPRQPSRTTLTLNNFIANRDFRNSLNMGLLCGFLMPSLMAGGVVPFTIMALVALRTVLGLGALEVVYGVQERIIQSQEYYQHPKLMLVTSLVMVPLNAAVTALGLSVAKWGVLAFLLNHACREYLDDSYRRF